MSQADRAIESLYENTDVREDLTDDEAQILLKWGEARIAKLAEQGMDDVAFDEALGHLMELLTHINRMVGRSSFSTAEEQQTWMDKIAESAAALGSPLPPQPETAEFKQQAAPDNITTINQLTALIDESVEANLPFAPTTPSESLSGDVNDEEEIEC